MYISDILCSYKEYRRNGDSWYLSCSNSSFVDSNFIQNMVDAGYYFTSMGGYQDVRMRSNRRFGVQVIKVTCVSFCGHVRKVFTFNYDNARGL